MRKLKWATHADLAIDRNLSVGREEYLDYMTFRSNWISPLSPTAVSSEH